MASGNDLRLQVILQTIDRASAVLTKIQGRGGAAAKALKDTRDKLRDLTTQQKLVGEFRELRDGLQATTGRLAEAQAKVQTLARQIGQAGPPIKAMTRDFERAKQAAAALTEQHDRQSEKTQALRDRLAAAGISTRNLGTDQRRLRSDIAATSASVAEQTAKLQAQTLQMRRTAELRDKHAKAMMHTGVAVGAGVAASAIGQAGVTRLMGPSKTFGQHEDAMLGVARQVEGARELGQLTPIYRAIEEQVRSLSHELPIPTTQIAEMVTAAARMDVPREKLAAFTRTAAMMATAFDAVPDQITETMGKVAVNFKIPLTEIGSLADSINFLDDNAISKGADIVEYLNRVSGSAATAKMSVQDYAALGSTLLTFGERTETAGTATNAIISKFAAAEKGTKKFTAAMKEIGLSTKAVQKGMATDAMGTLMRVITDVRKLPDEKRVGVMVELVGLEHADTLAKLVDKPEELQRQRNLASGDKAKGSMEREFAARMDTQNAQLQTATNRFFNLSAVVGESMKPALLAALNVINPLVQRLSAWAQRNAGLVGGVMVAGMAISMLAVALGTLLIPLAIIVGKGMLLRFLFARLAMTFAGTGAAATAAGGGLGLLARVGGLVGRGFALVVGLLGRLPGVLALVGRALMGVMLPLLANPFGLAVLAIGLLIAAGYLLYRNWDGIKGGLVAIWEGLGGSIGAVLSNIGAAIVNWSPLGLFYQAFAGVLRYFGFDLPAKFSEFGSQIVSGLVSGITSMLGVLRDAIGNAAGAAIGWFKDKLGIRSPSRVFMAAGTEIGNGAALGISSRSEQVRQAAAGLAAVATLALPGFAAAGEGGAAMAFDMRAPLSAAAARAPAAVTAGDTITINITPTPGMDPQAIARAVSAELDRRQREQGARRGSSLRDYD